MHLTLGETQSHLLVYLASVLEQCPVHGPFLEGTGHCKIRFDKGQGTEPGVVKKSHLQRIRSLLRHPKTSSP